MIQRWLPFPRMFACMLAMWLLLNQSLAPAHVLFGLLLAVYGSRLLVRLDMPNGAVRRPWAALRLSMLVLIDIIRSNIAVARIILRIGGRHKTAGFLEIPLTMRNPNGLATLACIITATPGTLWVDYDSSRGVLLMHVLDLIDEEQWIRIIKGRYERLLLEIFE